MSRICYEALIARTLKPEVNLEQNSLGHNNKRILLSCQNNRVDFSAIHHA